MDFSNKRLKQQNGIQFAIVLIVGIVLIYFSVRNINLQDLIRTIEHGHFAIAIPVFAVSLTGYYFRSLRWKLLLDPMKPDVPVSYLFTSLSIGYAVNIATPRLGEVARCLVLKRSKDVSLEHSGISVVVERVVDIISLAIVVIVASVIQVNESSLFIRQYILAPIAGKIKTTPWFLILIALIVMGLIILSLQKLIRKWMSTNIFLHRAVDALRNIIHLKFKSRFILYTILIWTCYFLMTYLWFNIFDETQNLGVGAAFILMAIGSIGRSVPIQGGGMGAYHFLVSNAFGLFGIGLVTGNAMAFVIHGAQIIFTFVLGILCWIWILFKKQTDEI
jgi:uncharacterized protein (TIRG00374 family)